MWLARLGRTNCSCSPSMSAGARVPACSPRRPSAPHRLSPYRPLAVLPRSPAPRRCSRTRCRDPPSPLYYKVTPRWRARCPPNSNTTSRRLNGPPLPSPRRRYANEFNNLLSAYQAANDIDLTRDHDPPADNLYIRVNVLTDVGQFVGPESGVNLDLKRGDLSYLRRGDVEHLVRRVEKPTVGARAEGWLGRSSQEVASHGWERALVSPPV